MQIKTAAIVGSGLVGASWAIVFARAGIEVRLFDRDPEIRRSALAGIRHNVETMVKRDLISNAEEIVSRIAVVDGLKHAVMQADYVQESVFERQDVKAAVSIEIGALIRDDAVVGSSSSGIPASAFTREAPQRSRFLVAHPVNPPHLLPLVEIVPAPWTDPEIVPWLRDEMERLGQMPIVVHQEIEGFVLNRLQGALLNEAWALFDDGVASAADIDRTVLHGLGMRWALMGPFETIDLNAPGGVRDYAVRLGPLYHRIACSRRDAKAWSPELIERVTDERRGVLPEQDLKARAAWRDRRLMSLAAFRRDATDE